MKVCDLVRLSEAWSAPEAVQHWGFGFVDKVHTEYFSVDVVWPQLSCTSSKIPWSRVEVVSEDR